MGYTHYWRRSRDFTEAEWEAITRAFTQIEPHLEVALDDDGDEAGACITPHHIVFNGFEEPHETMNLTREMGGRFSFCKTARKPYDTRGLRAADHRPQRRAECHRGDLRRSQR